MNIRQAQLPEGWEIKEFEDCLDKVVYSNKIQRKDFHENGEYPIISQEQDFINGYWDKREDLFEVKKPVVIFGDHTQVLKYIDFDFVLGADGVKILQPKKDIDSRFFYYFLHSLAFVSLGYARHYRLLKEVDVYFPNNLPQQQRIVSILDECFAAIGQAKANAKQNLKNAKELFESYLQGMFIKIYQTRETKSISQVAKVIGGHSFKSGDFKKQGKYQVLRMGNIRPGIIRENESAVFIDTVEEKVLSKALLLLNDVIITQTGTKNKRDYGFTVIIEKEHFLLNQRITSIRFSEDYLAKFFLYFSWTNLFKDQYFANETGTVGQGNVGIGAITDSKIPYLPIPEQHVFVTKIDDLLIETQKLEAIYQKKLDDLEELKKSILQKAFSGELKPELINSIN
jgi:type I restriction enzyme S subunit